MTQLGKVCSACGRERSKTKSILFDPNTLYPYCESPYICSSDHPNAPANLLKRGAELKLIPLSEAQKLFKEYLIKTVGDPEKILRIRNMVDKPMTIRIGDPELARFILELQDMYQMSSVSDAIRYCIQTMKENKEGYIDKVAEVRDELEQKQVEKILINSVEKQEPIVEPEPEPVLETIPADPEEEEWKF